MKLPSSDVQTRVAADYLTLCLAIGAAAAIDVAISTLGSSIGAAPAGYGERSATIWRSVLPAWLVAFPLTVVIAFWAVGLYGTVRSYTVAGKARRVLVGSGAASLAWVLFVQFPGVHLSAPVLGTALAVAGAGSGPTLSRVVLTVLVGAGVVESRVRPRVHGRPTKNVLVIGGAGYIGAEVSRSLLGRGYSVRVLDTLLYGDESVSALRRSVGFELIHGDVRDLSTLVAATDGVDAVVHLAAIVGDPACELDPRLTFEVNLLSTRQVREVASALDVQRLVFASTCSVYGSAREIVDENSVPKPVSLYGRTKLRSEELLLARHGDELATTVLRFATLFGLSARLRFDLVANLFVAQAVFDGLVTVHGGSQWRPLLHVRDAAAAIVRVLEAPRALVERQVFNIGSDSENYTIGQVAEVVTRETGARLQLIETSVDPRNYRVSFAKARTELRFSPTVTLTDGVRELANRLRQMQREGAIDYRHSVYSNVQHLANVGNLVARDHALRELVESS